MDGRSNRLCRRIGKKSAALRKKTVARADDGIRGSRTQANDQVRLDEGKFRLQPGLARSDFRKRRFFVEPPLAAFLET
jgi:hypothetical protein